MVKTAIRRVIQAPLSPSLGLQMARLCGLSDVPTVRYSRFPTARTVRFGTQLAELPADTASGDDRAGAAGQVARTPVASATLDAGYLGVNYRVTAWQPAGKPAFVFLIVVGERKLLQPNIAEGADFDEVMQHAARFVEQLLEEDPSA